METLNAQVIEMLKEHCDSSIKVSAYMKHVIIEIPEVSLEVQFIQQKQEIIALIEEYFPERNDDLPITIRTINGSRAQTAFVRKTSQ